MDAVRRIVVVIGCGLVALGVLLYFIVMAKWVENPSMAVDSKYHMLYAVLLMISGLGSILLLAIRGTEFRR